MLGNGHVPFLGGGMMATSSCYPTATSLDGTDTSRLCSWLLPTQTGRMRYQLRQF